MDVGSGLYGALEPADLNGGRCQDQAVFYKGPGKRCYLEHDISLEESLVLVLSHDSTFLCGGWYQHG